MEETYLTKRIPFIEHMNLPQGSNTIPTPQLQENALKQSQGRRNQFATLSHEILSKVGVEPCFKVAQPCTVLNNQLAHEITSTTMKNDKKYDKMKLATWRTFLQT